MRRTIRLSIAFTVAFLAARAQTGPTVPISELEASLNQQLKDKIVTLRSFYRDRELRFTADGFYKGHKDQGSWTLWSKFRITKIEVAAERLKLRGERLFLVYDAKQSHFLNVPSKEQMAVVVEFDGAPVNPQSAESALAHILLRNGEHLSALVPEEWKGFLQLQEDGLHSLPTADPKQGQYEPFKIVKGITPPRVLSAPDPEYQEQARQASLQGTVVLWAVVNVDGRISDLRIARPLGMGLDEKAIEAVRRWHFEPAKKLGKPVRSQLNIEINFRLR